MRWPHNAKIRLADAWSVDNELSPIEAIDELMMADALQECLSRFPKIDALKARLIVLCKNETNLCTLRNENLYFTTLWNLYFSKWKSVLCEIAKWSIGSSYLRSWRYCNFADWFWKKPDFSIVLCGKVRFEPKYVHFSGCPAKQDRGRLDRWTDRTWIHCRSRMYETYCRRKVQLHFLLCWAMLVGRISKQVDKTKFLHACPLWFFKKILHGKTILIELSAMSSKIDTSYTAKIVARRLLCWSSSTGKLFPRCFAHHNIYTPFWFANGMPK